jgi:hypothetical protein
MKQQIIISLFIAINICFSTANKSSAQNSSGDSIVVVKHDPGIDTMLNGMIKIAHKVAAKDSFFMITIEQNKEKLYFHVILRNQSEVAIEVNDAHLSSWHLGFFQIGNYRVFLSSNEDFTQLFTKTNEYKKFDFIKFSDKSPLETPVDIPLMGFFVYSNGKITVDDSITMH